MTTENMEKWLNVIQTLVKRYRLSSTLDERKQIAIDIAEQSLWLLELVDSLQIGKAAVLEYYDALYLENLQLHKRMHELEAHQMPRGESHGDPSSYGGG